MTIIIDQVDLSENCANFGLPPIKLYKLGDLVAVVGPNGVGKSRLIDILKRELSAQSPYVRLSVHSPAYPLGVYIPPDLKVEEDHTSSDEADEAEIFSLPNCSWLLECTFSVISELALSAVLAGSGLVNRPTISTANVLGLWNRVRGNVQALLGTQLGIDGRGRPTLFGQPLKEAKISEGQARLLQLAVVLSIQAEDHPVIIFWDEPELHLHPGIVIRVLEQMRASLKCQIWLATHSLPLTAYAGVENIWYMDSAGIDRGTRKLEELLSGLYGSRDEGERLTAFFSSPHRLAESTFALQCLFEPTTVSFRSGDPQGMIAFSDVQPTPARPLRVLDWGAAQGRLLQAAIERWPGTTTAAIDYFAYDTNDKDQETCARLISSVWGQDAKNRWTQEFAKVRATFSQSRADRVLMCNVLHEIPPPEWREVISRVSDIISPTGYLMIMEDLKLPSGELPFKKGFLLLDEPAIRCLINHCEGILATTKDDRLASYLIPSPCLSITEHSYRETLTYCLKSEIDKIEDLRHRPDKTYKQGIDHMRSAMQFITAYLCLDDLPSRRSE